MRGDAPDSELAERLAFLERHVEEQDRAVYALNRDVEALRQEVARLRAQVRRLAEASEGSAGLSANERPPHY
jgi:uncharacterized coiled-coil protein SlyX